MPWSKLEGVENKGDEVMDKIIDHFKPEIYKEKSYIISKGEPLDFILLITQGVVWCYRSTSDQIEAAQGHDTSRSTSTSAQIEHRTRHYY